MQETRTRAQEAAEDVFFGQAVMIWARWAVIAAAAVLILWTSSSIRELEGKVLVVVGLMAINFFLHGRYLMERPANRYLVVLASMVDVALITAMVVISGGFQSAFFVLLYPVVAAFALVFPPRLAIAFTAATVGLYSLSAMLNPPADYQQLKVLLVRVITLAAMGALGTYYWRVERDRRRRAATAS